MAETHPNIELMKRVDPTNIRGCAEVFRPDVVWHFFNPKLPEVHGDYIGVEGICSFFERMADTTGGTFQVNVVAAYPIGDELVVAQTRNTMSLEEAEIAVDVVTVWRIVEGQIDEVWDIPAVYTADVISGALPETATV